MAEQHSKKEINPTVRVVVSMNQREKKEFTDFSKKANIPLSAVVRMAVKNFIKNEGATYLQ